MRSLGGTEVHAFADNDLRMARLEAAQSDNQKTEPVPIGAVAIKWRWMWKFCWVLVSPMSSPNQKRLASNIYQTFITHQ